MNTGDKYDNLPAGLHHIEAVIFERIATIEDDDAAVEFSEDMVEDYILDRVRDRARVQYSQRSEEQPAAGGAYNSVQDNKRESLGPSHNRRLPQSAAERMQKSRASQSDEQREQETRNARDGMAALRFSRTPEERANSNEADRQR